MRLESNRLALGIEEECLFCWCNFLWRLFYGHHFGTLLGLRDFWQKTWVFEVCHWVFLEIAWDFASVLLFFALFKLNVQMYIYNKHKNWAHTFFSWISWVNFDGVFGKSFSSLSFGANFRSGFFSPGVFEILSKNKPCSNGSNTT